MATPETSERVQGSGPVPMAKETALEIQQELRECLVKRESQDHIKKLEERRCESDSVFKKGVQRVSMSAQKDMIPEYGFTTDSNGFDFMRDAIQQLEDDPEVSDNIGALSQPAGKAGDDLELLTPILQPGLIDAEAPTSKPRGLKLQSRLVEGLLTPEYQALKLIF